MEFSDPPPAPKEGGAEDPSLEGGVRLDFESEGLNESKTKRFTNTFFDVVDGRWGGPGLSDVAFPQWPRLCEFCIDCAGIGTFFFLLKDHPGPPESGRGGAGFEPGSPGGSRPPLPPPPWTCRARVAETVSPKFRCQRPTAPRGEVPPPPRPGPRPPRQGPPEPPPHVGTDRADAPRRRAIPLARPSLWHVCLVCTPRVLSSLLFSHRSPDLESMKRKTIVPGRAS